MNKRYISLEFGKISNETKFDEISIRLLKGYILDYAHTHIVGTRGLDIRYKFGIGNTDVLINRNIDLYCDTLLITLSQIQFMVGTKIVATISLENISAIEFTPLNN